MNISILTWSHTINYGGSLQAFALQYYLRAQGYNVHEIEYTRDNDHIFNSKLLELRSYIWQNTGKRLLEDKTREIKFAKFYDENFLYHDKKYNCLEDFLSTPIDADAFIVGSDQVWNPNMIRNDEVWFLNFTEKKKISYAASFGLSALTKEYARFCMPLIDQFDAISVREATGRNIIRQYLPNKKVETVIDPVFLLDRDTWAKYAISNQRRKYVLCYYMPGNSKVEKKIADAANTYAIKHGIDVINIGKREYGKLMFWQNNLYGLGQSDFLGLFMNAEAVFTNSFHGTAFSIIFEKPFCSFVDSTQRNNNVSSRITDILSAINCSNVLANIDIKDKEPNIIGKESQRILSNLITKSKEFLLTAIEE